MPTGSGLSSQFGMITEVTYGTWLAPTRFLEYNSETVGLTVERINSSALRAGNRFLRTDRWAANRKGAGGDYSFDVQNKGFGLLFQHMLGAAPTIDTTGIGGTLTTAKHMTFVPTDPTGMFFTSQLGVPDTGGTVRCSNYMGCKVASWTLNQALDAFLELKCTIDAQDEDTTVHTTVASASYAATTTNFDYSMCVVNIGGSPVPVESFDLTYDAGLDLTRYFLQGSTLKKEPLPNAFGSITGTIGMEFTDLTQYARFRDGTLAPVTVQWTGPALPGADSAFKFILKLTLPQVRFDGTSPDVSGPDLVHLSAPFTATWDGTVAPLTLEYQTSDTTP